ncbi:1,4-dihydroxy-2-naphthoate polyprenyltransferase, partial [Cronobacter sakazakii]
LVGSALAGWQGYFDPVITLLALLTAGLLQILSNLANDYGDAVKGSDQPDRLGPLRGMQKGAITAPQMKRAIQLTVALICVSGLALVYVACHSMADVLGFLALGALSILAAITYTVGTRPYGYMGLGDVSVLIFFGWLSVLGSWYLQAHTLIAPVWLPATACGLLAAAVLNINNLRDIDSDRRNGKNTLAVRLGPVAARRYHVALLAGALVCLAAFNLLWLHSLWGWLFLLATPLLARQARFVLRETEPAAMRPMLERTVKAALLVNLLFIIGLIVSQQLR